MTPYLILSLLVAAVCAVAAVWCWNNRIEYKNARDFWIRESRNRVENITELTRERDELADKMGEQSKAFERIQKAFDERVKDLTEEQAARRDEWQKELAKSQHNTFVECCAKDHLKTENRDLKAELARYKPKCPQVGR